jgi:prolyl oligopeptidase
LRDRILVLTDSGAPNRRIVEIGCRNTQPPGWIDFIPETDMRIESWWALSNQIFVYYAKQATCQIHVFDFSGRKIDEIPMPSEQTVRVIGALPDSDELLLETESFTKPVAIVRYCARTKRFTDFARKRIPFESTNYGHLQVWFSSKDGTRIPMYLVGRLDVLEKADNP